MPIWYATETTISPDQCDPNGLTRPDAWFQLFQWIAGEHSRELLCDHDGDLPASILWILLGARAQWRKPARAGDVVRVETAPSAHSHGMYQRETIVSSLGGDTIASSVGFWTLMNRDTRRITRCDAIQRRHELTGLGRGLRPVPFARLVAARRADWSYTPGAIDMDENGHVNNARYIAWMDEALRALAGCSPSMRTLDAWYAAEVLPGEPLTGRAALSESGDFTFEAFRLGNEDDKACFTASGTVELP
jgi:medium-chain acyl-[acyl-carrier-protein] hydrolase